ncbi:DUF3187 family protein [uncultured Vibrio sp.]|uniref:DUF3187 family protein n=1 Tax=uncultured Vibrio sp. TaxID=114054 RepID=UPI00091A3ED4|nr:DUF3187 family protein [uncultured Vibrio sp.]OIQ24573.1 MAG: hypothetical protein BM561_09230 [Vibrio sp. MedPE-SWchi]
MVKWVALFWLILFSPNSMAKDIYGPLLTYSQSPFHVNSLTPQLRSGFPNEPDVKEISITGTAASIWVDTASYHADYYQNQLAIAGKWQVDDKWLVELNYRLNYAENNGLDGLTKAFHNLFGIDQNGRDQVDDDRFIIELPEYGISLENFDGKALSNAITSYFQYQAYTENKHGLTFGISLYYNNVNKGIFSSTRFEQAMQFNYSYANSPHHFDALLGLTLRHSPSVFKEFPLKKNTLTSGLSYRYEMWERHHFVIQLSVLEGVSNRDDDFSDPSTELIYGYRYLMDNSAVEFSIIENALNADNSTDIAFTLGYRYRITP